MKRLFLLCGFLLLLTSCTGIEPAPANALSEALTVTVLALPIDQAVVQISENLSKISYRLVCVNALSDTVIDKSVGARFHTGDTLTEFRKRVGAEMKKEIDAYQARHTIFNSAAFNATAAILEAGLDGGIQ